MANESLTEKNLLIACFKNSTAHAVPKIIRGKNTFIKLLWGCCFATCSIYCVYSLVLSTRVFLTYPSYVKIELLQEAIPIEFPAVTFCNMKKIDKIKAKSHIETVDEMLTDDIIKNNSPLVYSYVAMFYLKKSIVAENKSLSSYGYDISSMIISCMFNYRACQEQDFVSFHDPLYGNCYTFNSGKFENGSKTDVKKVSLQGPQYGLSLEVFTGNPRIESKYEINDGLIVFIQKQADTLYTLGGDRVLVPNGADTDIKVKKSVMHKLPYPYGNCLEDTSKESNFKSTYFEHIVRKMGQSYHQQYCHLLCVQKHINKKCKCLYVDLPSMDMEMEMCATEENINCLIDIISNFSEENNDCQSACPLPCKITQFEISNSRGTYPSDHYKSLLIKDRKLNASGILYEDLEKATLRFNVFYESMIYTKTKEIPSINTEVFISNIGGTLGFYLGISILTFVEFIELIVNLLQILYKRCFNKIVNSPQDI